jgi:hypothetical protein
MQRSKKKHQISGFLHEMNPTTLGLHIIWKALVACMLQLGNLDLLLQPLLVTAFRACLPSFLLADFLLVSTMPFSSSSPYDHNTTKLPVKILFD